VLKVILKCSGVDILILCTYLKIMLKLERKKKFFPTFTAVEITFHFLALMSSAPRTE